MGRKNSKQRNQFEKQQTGRSDYAPQDDLYETDEIQTSQPHHSGTDDGRIAEEPDMDKSQSNSTGGRVMGKETKIGVAVIVVLMLAFSIVLGMRLNKTATAENAPKVKVSAKDLTPKFAKSTPTKINTTKSTKPIAVSAKAKSAEASVLKADGSTSRWSFATATKKPTSQKTPLPKTSLTNDTSTTPLRQKTPIVSPADRYGRPISSKSTRAPGVQAWPDIRNAKKPHPLSHTATLTPAPTPKANPVVAKKSTTFLHARPHQSLGANSLKADPVRTQIAKNPIRSQYNGKDYTNGSKYGQTARRENHQSNMPRYHRSTARMSRSQHTDSLNLPQYKMPQATRNDDGSYTIQPNDSYWTISQKLYENGGYFKALAEYNANKFPENDQLRVGDTIDAPDYQELEKRFPHLCPKPEHKKAAKFRSSGISQFVASGRNYTVEPGDTLYDIAKYELGNATRWVEIYELNKTRLGDNFDYLTNGMQLTLPDDASPGTAKRRSPTSAYHR